MLHQQNQDNDDEQQEVTGRNSPRRSGCDGLGAVLEAVAVAGHARLLSNRRGSLSK